MYNNWQVLKDTYNSNPNQNVDWGALATQWVQQREFMQQSPIQMMPHMIGIPPPNNVQIPMHFNIPPPMPPASQQQTMSMHFPPAHIPAPVPPPSHTT
ncbi:unnamed protein product, partial [Didymodactylos carnosus]